MRFNLTYLGLYFALYCVSRQNLYRRKWGITSKENLRRTFGSNWSSQPTLLKRTQDFYDGDKSILWLGRTSQLLQYSGQRL